MVAKCNATTPPMLWPMIKTLSDLEHNFANSTLEKSNHSEI